MPNALPELCGVDDCRRLAGHGGTHSQYPTEPWNFFGDKDKKKLVKVGFATPRGGKKGAYQNHVVRSNQVIIPFERLGDVDLALYKNGYVIRLLPEQYFSEPRVPKPIFTNNDPPAVVGVNAFVLYRSHESFENYLPMDGWEIRRLMKNGEIVKERGNGATDEGHYVLRLPTLGAKPKRDEGPPQGLFATEYCDEDTNFLCKCVLAWLTIITQHSPYSTDQAGHLLAILIHAGLYNLAAYERAGVIREGSCCCPLCLRIVHYEELHKMVTFDDASGLGNAGMQVVGATRSTAVNLFHIQPLIYHALVHIPTNVAWGHAVCNTRLGQRHCFGVDELKAQSRRVLIAKADGTTDELGWISEDGLMVRSPNGAVWIQLNGDIAEGPPAEPAVFDSATEGIVETGDELPE
jgi:hypothetical protein